MDAVSVVGPLPDGAGPLGLLSSDEFTGDVEDFDRALIDATGPRVALILAAAGAGRPAELAAASGMRHYRRLGAEPVVVDVLSREEADARALPDYDVLFMCGGSPRSLLRTLRGSSLWDEALRRWRAGAGLAGSSAGAMALCTWCMIPGPGDKVPTQWTEGLGPLDTVALAVHAATRSNEWLSDVAATSPRAVVALDDKTGIVIDQTRPVVRGPGRVRLG